MSRVLVAGIGADHGGDDPLAATAAELRKGGAEVIFSGWDQAPAQVVRSALQEDVAAIRLCGATDVVLAQIHARLAEEGAEDIAVSPQTR